MPIAMNRVTPTKRRQTGITKQGMLVSLLLLALILVFAWFMLPPGFNTDTKLIGKGRPAVVLIYSANSTVSSRLMGEFNKIRGEYASQVEFLIVDVNAPGGKEFVRAHSVAAPGALFFSGDGQKITEVYAPTEAAALKDMMRQAFGF